MKLFHTVALYVVPCCLWFCCLTTPANGQPTPDDLPDISGQTSSVGPLTPLCLEFNALNTRIRDNRIDTASARVELKRILAKLRDRYFLSGGLEYPRSSWVFPLEGYDVRAIGAGRRHGYVARGYDFFSGNRHGGHPSYDIFIRDRNRDSLDDRSGTPVRVRSLTGGVVVALEREWQAGSRLRGGRYIWVYDPANDLLVYYAHNGELSVGLGDVVRPGDPLASVGRSGFNAARRLSPTHLHLTAVRVQDGRVVPLEVYRELKQARPFQAGVRS